MARTARKDRIKTARRPLDACLGFDQVLNKEPGREYVYASPDGEGQHSVQAYEYLGYRVEKYRKDGPRPAVGATGKIGEVITMRDHVLMSIEDETVQERWEMGQLFFDKIQRRIEDPSAAFQMDGFNDPYIRVANETRMGS